MEFTVTVRCLLSLEGVLDLLAGVFEVGRDLIELSFVFSTLVAG